MGSLTNRCSGTGQLAIAASDGIGQQCPVCGMLTIPFKNGRVRKHNVLDSTPQTLLPQPAERPQWLSIETAPKDRTIIGALIRDGKVWRVHEMKHNGLAFYTTAGGSLPRMTHWMPMPEPPAALASPPVEPRQRTDQDNEDVHTRSDHKGNT